MGTVGKRIWLPVLLFLGSVMGTAQSVILRGRIYNSETHENIYHANVVIKNGAGAIITSITTGYNGCYQTDSLLPGSYRMEITACGFAWYEMNNIVLQPGRVVIFDAALHRKEETDVTTPGVKKPGLGDIPQGILKIAAH